MITTLEKKYLPKGLHNIYDDDEFEDFGKLEIESLKISKDKNEVLALLKFSFSADGLVKKYHFNFVGVEDYKIRPSTNPYIEISQDDHKLLIYNSKMKSLYFTKAADNPNLLIFNVCNLIYEKYKMKITIENIFTDYNQFLDRSKMNYGLYTTTAQEIIDAIFPLLEEQNMKPTIYTSTSRVNENKFKIMYIGMSYFVFDDLEVSQI